MTVKPLLFLFPAIIVTSDAHSEAGQLYRRQAESGNEVLEPSQELDGLKSFIKQLFPAEIESVSSGCRVRRYCYKNILNFCK